MTEPIRVLFLCTHNSARSQIAEAMLRQMGGPNFAAFSAGTEASRVHPLALHVLQEHGIRTDGLYSKSLSDYLGKPFDLVITVCDQANEHCPLFPGAPERLHWSIPDPSAVTGADEERVTAFRMVYRDLARRLPRVIERARHERDMGAHTAMERTNQMPTKTRGMPVSLPMRDDPACAPPVEVVRPSPLQLARLKAVADETRLTLLMTLLHAAEAICVCNLLPSAGVGQATVSHHLKVLREAGLIAVERRGIWAHYSICPAARDWLLTFLAEE
jgi:protein-tyrosine-phosphatase/DNA-binding transcriptional ArsR family regulator